MIEILHYLKDPKPWELWYAPYELLWVMHRISIISHRSAVDQPRGFQFFREVVLRPSGPQRFAQFWVKHHLWFRVSG